MKLKMAVLCTALALPGVAVNAKTFNEAGENDISTRDIHSQNNTLANGPHVLGRASLVYGNGHSFAIATGLANAWHLMSPQANTWIQQVCQRQRGSGMTAKSLFKVN